VWLKDKTDVLLLTGGSHFAGSISQKDLFLNIKRAENKSRFFSK
jgi:hypothetical protein